MRRSARGLATALATFSALSVLFFAPAATAVAAPSMAPAAVQAPAQARETGNCGEFVQVYRTTGPIERWQVRVTGVDLAGRPDSLIYPATRGVMNVAIESPDGQTVFEARSIPFDQYNSPSVGAVVNGPQVKVLASVKSDPPVNKGCSTNRDILYPGQ